MGKTNSKLKQSSVRKLVIENEDVFNEREVQDWYKGFVRNCPTGHLYLEDVIRVFKAFFTDGDPTKFATIVYNALEKNEEGVVGFPEFLKCLALLGRGTPDEKVQWAFKVFDKDSDGLVSREDMFEVVDAIYKMVGSVVKQMNEDVNTPVKRIEKLFKQAELGKKERMTFDAFCDIVQHDKPIWIILGCDMTDSELKS